MTGEAIAFWLVAAVLVAASLAVVLTPNLFHAVLFLAAALVATGVVFLLLGSPFLFAVQLLLYAGGVVTIMVFAIMLTERLVGDRLTQTNRWILAGSRRGRGGPGRRGRLPPPRGPAGAVAARSATGSPRWPPR